MKKIISILLISFIFFCIIGCGSKQSNEENGKSAYELALENGFSGTLNEWLASLKGEQGVSVVSVEKIKTENNIDTYQIKLSNGNTFDFEVTNATTHNYQYAYTLVKPTTKTDGIDVYYCTDCNELLMKKVEKITYVSTYIREDDKIYFGNYPQTLVEDNELICELNTAAGDLPTSTNTYNWTDYNYYIEEDIVSYMYYQDIDLENDGIFDYRGVYFTQYRPYDCIGDSSSENSNQDDNGYLTNTTYWFSYEPIEWDILDEYNGYLLIIANLILDSQEYYSEYTPSEVEHNGAEGYANNYALSNIRKFLNEDFYDTAFNELQKELIEIATLDNSESSTPITPNKHACGDTDDNLFLLSYQEAVSYYTNDEERVALCTDYAKVQGIYDEENGYDWWLRSPDNIHANCACIVTENGSNGRYDSKEVDCTECGVRPACWINLE